MPDLFDIHEKPLPYACCELYAAGGDCRHTAYYAEYEYEDDDFEPVHGPVQQTPPPDDEIPF